ncbi:hypothetical protein ALC57_07599 [Trachymyrmex cornetzi]|uniref:Uncharacterized protein n=1 Tax=Trachymyrmex cornetzi TaxID=471704 RepID=A0A151J7R8_9HYME|nr:hypothetical protein ALC57_07599 [Trachymyrmex cornetzi]
MYSILLIHTFYGAEGENYGDSAVGFVELKQEGCFCYIQGKVCPEHRVNSKLCSVSMLVDEKNEKVEYVKCDDCAASAGILKLTLIRNIYCRSEEFESIATVCYWKKPRLAQIGANVKSMRAKDLLSSKPVPVLPNNDGFLQILLHEMEKIKFDCQLSRHFDNFLSFAISSAVSGSCPTGCHPAKDTTDQNQSTMWKKLRYGRITASRIYEIPLVTTFFRYLLHVFTHFEMFVRQLSNLYRIMTSHHRRHHGARK